MRVQKTLLVEFLEIILDMSFKKICAVMFEGEGDRAF